MRLDEMISEIQGRLGVTVDGKPGPETWGAIYKRIVAPTIDGLTPIAAISTVDARSESYIKTLLPEVQPIARALVQKAASVGIKIKVISGLRTFAQQDALFAIGRTTPGKKVTNARGGESNHNFGIAFDVGVFEGAEYLKSSTKYKAVGMLGIDLGLEWGGSWTTFVDQPHFQLRPPWAQDMTEGRLLAELRGRADANQPIFT